MKTTCFFVVVEYTTPLSAKQLSFPFYCPYMHVYRSCCSECTFTTVTNATLTAIRQRFWIPSGQQRVKSLLHQCVICHKHCGKPYPVPDPPEICTRESEPFTITGIDFTGAMYVQDFNTKAKVYICLFTCATTRAIHLEIITNLSVETF